DPVTGAGLGRLNVRWVQGYKTQADGNRVYHDAAGNPDPTAEASIGYLMAHALHSYGDGCLTISVADGDRGCDYGAFCQQFLAGQTDYECLLGEDRSIPCLEYFNSGHDEANGFDSRSDAKGPEPEGIALGRIGEQTFAFIGLERMGGIMVFDITDPSQPLFQDYLNTRNNWVDEPEELAAAGRLDEAGDLGPEGLAFVSAEDSPSGEPLLIVGNEVSGTTAIFQIHPSERQ